MHFPVNREKGLNIVFGKKIWRTVRAIQHADFPFIAVMGNQFLRQRALGTGAPDLLALFGIHDMQYIAGYKSAPGVPPKLAESKSGFAAQIIRNLKTALNRQISAAAMIHEFTELQ